MASICLQIRYRLLPQCHTLSSMDTSRSVETEYTFPLAGKVKAFLNDPSAFVAVATPAAPAATPAAPAASAAPAKAEAKEQSDESEGAMPL